MQIKKHSNTQKFILCEGVAATCEGGFRPQSRGPEDETSSPGGISGQELEKVLTNNSQQLCEGSCCDVFFVQK